MPYVLVSGVLRNARHPNTFEIPDAADKRALQVGDFVKLGFTATGDDVRPGFKGDFTERMWVCITSPGQGRLDNKPSELTCVALGDTVAFEPYHILAIVKADELA